MRMLRDPASIAFSASSQIALSGWVCEWAMIVIAFHWSPILSVPVVVFAVAIIPTIVEDEHTPVNAPRVAPGDGHLVDESSETVGPLVEVQCRKRQGVDLPYARRLT